METPLIKALIDIFTEEKELLARFLSVSEQKKALIITEDVKKLGGLLETEAALTGQLSGLEEKRAALAAALERQLGHTNGSLTLARLAELTQDPRIREKLLALRNELSDLLKKQKRVNRTNQELISRKKDYIGLMLGVLLQEEPLDGTYDSSGCTGSRCQSSGLFDQSV
jgi:flagellar biosynthesis/type III secretory pathway chaperone